jgi:hypothetical protein
VQLTLAPDPIEVWPGFSQQILPRLLDANGNLIISTAGGYTFAGDRCVQVGPYGLTAFRLPGSGSMQVTNAGPTSNSVSYTCWPSAPCTFALSSSGEAFTADGGSDSVGVTTDPGPNQSTCPWTATSNVPWIAITAGSSGQGNGQVSFTVTANPGSARQGTITVNGQTFAITQDAAANGTRLSTGA